MNLPRPNRKDLDEGARRSPGETGGANRSPGEEGWRWLRSVVEHSWEVVQVVAPDGTLRYASPAFGRMFGYDPEEAVGTINVFDHVHPDDLPLVLEETERALLDEGVVSNVVEYRFRHKDGSWRHVQSVGTYLLDDPDVRGVLVTVRDVTERVRAEERLRAQYKHLPVPTYTWQRVGDDLVLVDHNDAAVEYSQGLVGALLGARATELLSDWPGYAEMMERCFSERTTLRRELPWRMLRTGEERRFVVTCVFVPPDLVMVHTEDVTEERRAEERLRFQAQLLGAVGEAVIALDPDGKVVYWNRAAEEMFGWSAEETMGRRLGEMIVPDDLRGRAEEIRKQLSSGKSSWSGEFIVRRRDGTPFPVMATDTPVFDGEGEVGHVIGVLRDLTEPKALEKRLEHQAFHDLLTGLPNRHLFVDRLEQALRRTRRREGRKAAVLFMDLDGFKLINDSLGHEVGDRLLVAVAERLESCLRPEDTLARLGGDEFTVLLEDVEDPDEPVRVAGRIVEELRAPFFLEGRELYVAASIGVSMGSAHTKGPNDLLRDADTAMYQVKRQGSGHKVFDPSMHDRALKRLEAEHDLRRAIEREEFVVHYQPVVNLHTDELWGLEALVRWNHPERSPVDPGDFIPLAEESGLVVPMGEQVLEEACRRAQEWQQAYPRVPSPVMCVNLSARQIGRPDLAEVVEGMLDETGLDGPCLSLDVTETVYVEALERNMAALDRLREMGVRISIDDFGTGYSSLAYLKGLPADALKIDRSFVKGLGEEVEDTMLVRMMIELAHTFGMEVIAEGVESWSQAALLKEMGCDLAQGFYFSEPLLPEEVPKLLAG